MNQNLFIRTALSRRRHEPKTVESSPDHIGAEHELFIFGQLGKTVIDMDGFEVLDQSAA